ncbi:hypothetical protein QTP88_016172 [Uroleucon formosanum]
MDAVVYLLKLMVIAGEPSAAVNCRQPIELHSSNHQDNQIHQPTSSKEEQSSERLENTQIPKSPTFIEEVPKTYTEWTVETPTPPLKIPAPTNPESIQQHITTIESPSILPSTNNQDVNILNICTQEQNKRSLSDTTSQKSPSSPKSDQQPIKKKPKVLPGPNSSTKPEGKNLDSILQSTVPFFSSTEYNSSITYLQFKFILENSGNKQINIHSLCKDRCSNISSIFETIEKIRPYIDDRLTKTKLTKLRNLLFQSLPLQDKNRSS